MKNLEVGDVVSECDFWQHYVYELLDDQKQVFYIGSTTHPRQTLAGFIRPVLKKRHEIGLNMALKRAVSQVRDLRMRIVSIHLSQEDSERSRDFYIESLGDKAPFLNSNVGTRRRWSYG